MNEQRLDERKLNMIKVKVIEIEKDQLIKKDTSAQIIENIKKYIERVVDVK